VIKELFLLGSLKELSCTYKAAKLRPVCLKVSRIRFIWEYSDLSA